MKYGFKVAFVIVVCVAFGLGLSSGIYYWLYHFMDFHQFFSQFLAFIAGFGSAILLATAVVTEGSFDILPRSARSETLSYKKRVNFRAARNVRIRVPQGNAG